MANGGLAGSSLGVIHKADAKTHQNGGNNSAAGNCAKCWTIDTTIRHHHWTNCPHRNKPKLTETQKNQARTGMKKEEEDLPHSNRRTSVCPSDELFSQAQTPPIGGENEAMHERGICIRATRSEMCGAWGVGERRSSDGESESC
jgi:hypothetical protein